MDEFEGTKTQSAKNVVFSSRGLTRLIDRIVDTVPVSKLQWRKIKLQQNFTTSSSTVYNNTKPFFQSLASLHKYQNVSMNQGVLISLP